MQGYRAGLAELVLESPWMSALQLSAPEHVTVPLGEHESITCVTAGLWLVRDDDGPLVVMLRADDSGMGESLAVEVMAPERERAERVLAALWTLMRERNVYRGRVLELRVRHFHDEEGAPLTVRTLPPVERERIVLPAGVLERSNARPSGSPSTQSGCAPAAATSAAGCCCTARPVRERRSPRCTSPPHARAHRRAHDRAGTGRGRDVDRPRDRPAARHGRARGRRPRRHGPRAQVHQRDPVRVAQRDGRLDEDHDVMFVLTTNRADLLEPALAARPGRVDEAVELPLPDADGRRRLLALYGEGLDVTLEGDGLVADLEGTSPAFIRELLRRGALLAAEESDGPLRVSERHLTGALNELRHGGENLTNTLLGAHPERAALPTEDE